MPDSKLIGLFGKLSMSKYELLYWLSVPEFVDEITPYAVSGVKYSDNLVLDIMMDIYKYKRQFPDRADGFSFRTARRSIRKTAKAIGAEKDVEVYF